MITGAVLDQSGAPLRQAAVAGSVRSTATAEGGRFSVTNLPAGTYAVDVSAAGFAKDSRTGLRVASAATVPLTISMSVAGVSQTIDVEAAVTLAVEAAPSQSSLDAKSAESVIGSAYIRNFISPTGDYSDVLQMSPGSFSVSPKGPGLGDTKTFFRGFKDGFLRYDVRRNSVQRHQRSHAPLLVLVSDPLYRQHRFRSQSG
jgi:hypothetical protein